MKSLMLLAIVGLFAGLFYARVLGDRAMRLLSKEEKLALIDGFLRVGTLSMLPLMGVVFWLAGLFYLPERFYIPSLILIAAAFAGYMALKHRWVNRRLRELSISEPYIASVRRAQWVSYGGWAVFMVFLWLSVMR